MYSRPFQKKSSFEFGWFRILTKTSTEKV